MDHGGMQDRALADARTAEQHGEARSEQVRDDRLGVTLAAEEEQRVELALVERAESLVRACGGLHGGARHRAASSAMPVWRASRSTYSSTGSSSTSMSRPRHNARSSGPAEAETAHER